MRTLTESDQSLIMRGIDTFYKFITGSISGTWQSKPSYGLEAVGESMGTSVEITFDNFTNWIKSLFKEGGIFNKIGKGIITIIRKVHDWLSTMINKVPGADTIIPGTKSFSYGNAIAIGLVAALVIIAFYKIFKGLLGSSKDDEENDRWNDRYSEALEQGNKLVVDFYNLTENMMYQYKYKMLSEGVFGGFFEFIGRTIRRAFKFVGEVFRDAYRGAKKHPILAFFVLSLCFFICFCMRNPFLDAAGQVAYMRHKRAPGLLAGFWNSAKNKSISLNSVGQGIQSTGHAIARGWDKASTFFGSLFSENMDIDTYIRVTFEKI